MTWRAPFLQSGGSRAQLLPRPGHCRRRRRGRDGHAGPEERPAGPGGRVASQDPVRVEEEAQDDEATTREGGDCPNRADHDRLTGLYAAGGHQPDGHQGGTHDDGGPDRADPRHRDEEKNVPRVE